MERSVEPIKEQFYLRRIAELEKEVAELRQQVATPAEQVARLSKNSSNSSKPPSSDIVRSIRVELSGLGHDLRVLFSHNRSRE